MGEVITIDQYKPLTAGDIQAQVNTIQHVMKQVMKKDTHYGIIPGTKTPSLYKPGAEKIMATFRLSADPEVTDLSDSDQIRYLVKVRLISPSGVAVGAGVGECSSNEEKYKWRAAICQEEFEDSEPGRKREKWCKGKYDTYKRSYGSPYKIQQIRTEPADLANTILKMAKKRGLIDAVLTTTAASDCFTQDIEDLPEEYLATQEQPAQKTSMQAETLTEAQIKTIKEAIEKTGRTEAAFCEKAQIERIEDLPQKRLAGALKLLEGVAK